MATAIPSRPTTPNPNSRAYQDAYEIVDGEIQEWPIMGTDAEEIGSLLLILLGTYVREANLGRAIGETRFQLAPRRQRRPDLAFISFAQWPKGRRAPDVAAWPLAPDLAVEVISKTDRARKVLAKVKEYFDAGARAVWLVYPDVEVIHVYHAWDRIEVVTRAGTLDGGAVVPGFRLPLAELFEGEDEPAAPGAEPAPGPAA